MINLSIVTVNRNDEAGLTLTAASVAPLVGPEVEWLVIDGGSSDGSPEVINRYHKLITYAQSRPDGGVYDAMNQGLRRARGRFVLFMNAGDRFAAPDSLDPLLPLLAADGAPDLLFGGAILELPCGRRVVRAARSPDRYLRYGLPACHQATVFRREAHLEAFYDPAYRITGDYALIARLLRNGATWRCVDDLIAIRACSPRSLSERRWARRILEATRVQKTILALSPRQRLQGAAHLMLSHVAYVGLRHLSRLQPRRLALPRLDLSTFRRNWGGDAAGPQRRRIAAGS